MTDCAVLDWLALTGNELDVKEVYIHPDHAGKLSKDDLKSWVLRADDLPTKTVSGEFYPVQACCNGVRFSCTYVNIRRSSAHFGELFRLTSHMSGDVELAPETFPDYLKELKRDYSQQKN